MSELDAAWGLHVVPGAVTGVLLRCVQAGRYEVVETLTERTSPDPIAAVRTARSLLGRRGLRGRAAFVALPDTSGCLVTATIPPEELDLSEDEMANELYEWTQFEPDAAELRHACVVRDGRHQERLVAALPRQEHRAFLGALEQGDVSRLGVGFAGVATWRGALALGLVPADGFLVEVLPNLTQVYAARGARVRRHLLALGEQDLARDATSVDVLAGDLVQLASYHRALRRGEDRSGEASRFALVGAVATAPGMRSRLASVLGPRLADADPGDAGVVRARAHLDPVSLPALAGAVGAALEALRPVEERIVLRHLPADLPPYRERSPLMTAAIAAALLVAAATGLVAWNEHHVTETVTQPHAPFEKRTEPLAAAREALRQPAEPPSPPVAPGPAAEIPAPRSDSIRTERLGDGRVRIQWGDGRAGRHILRRYVGTTDRVGEPVAVHVTDAVAGEWVDEVAGPCGLYEWSIDDGPAQREQVTYAVTVDLLGPGETGGARFALRRSWHGRDETLVVDVAPGASVTGAMPGSDASSTRLTFDSGWRLGTVRTRVETERAAVRVPRFAPDGRVERAADGAALTEERVIERERRIFEADGVAPDGTRRTWSRKMTDG